MKKLSTPQFIEKAKEIHGNKYNYNDTVYINTRTKLKIICDVHSHGIFYQLSRNHLSGQGCPICGGTKKLNTDVFIQRSIKKHGDRFDYSNSIYKTFDEKINIRCKKHDISFLQTSREHMEGFPGCPMCSKTGKKTTQQFIQEATELHGNRFDYSKSIYKGNHKKILISCKDKKHFFSRTPASHLTKYRGCPKCKSSKGELKILEYLVNNNIKNDIQKSFDDCRYINKLPFDFYLKDYNILLEYDGEGHYKPIKKFGGQKGFNNTKRNDNIKNKYCKDNNIKLIRIPYWDFDNIENILNNNIFT
jgi:hypothetical protein